MCKVVELQCGIFRIVFPVMCNFKRSFLFLFLLLSFFNYESLLAQKWTSLGPDSIPSLINVRDNSLRFAVGIGRVGMLKLFPSKEKKGNKSMMYLGTPFGGLWEFSTEDSAWSPSSTDALMNMGVSDFAINPKKPAIRYLITGDPDCIMDPNGPAMSSEYCQSRGIVKSIDGGLSWSDSAIGNWYNLQGEIEKDFWKYPSIKIARKLHIDSKCPDILTVIIYTYSYRTKTFDGMIYQSKDAGSTWKPRLTDEDAYLKDLEVKPCSRKVMYAAGRSVYKSYDRGSNWETLHKNGLPPDSLVNRIELALSVSKSSHLFALVIYKNSRTSDIFLSEDDGKTFIKIISAQASPEWRTAMVVDPSNHDLVFFTAGNKVHRLYRHNGSWRQEYTGGFIHDDVHDLNFFETNRTLYASTDGGLFSSTDSGRTWINLNKGLSVAQCWSVSVSQTGPLSILSGLQDCGTILNKSAPDTLAGWWIVRGGDGMATAFDYHDDYIMYANDGNNSLIARSIDGAYSWSRNLLPTRQESAIYQRPFFVNSTYQGMIYTGLENVYKSIDYGDSWKRFSTIEGLNKNERLVSIAGAEDDTLVFYAAYANPAWNKEPKQKLFRTNDAGQTWVDITHGLKGVAWTNISTILVDKVNADIVYVGFRGGWDFKVMRTLNGGKSWEDYSTDLGFDCDVNALIMDKDELHTVYAATHRGVYKRSLNDKGWLKFGDGLPGVMVSGLDIRYDSGILFAGTHGRGIWSVKIR